MKVGHYGAPALVALGAAIALLVIHLAVPFGVADHADADNDAGLDDEVLSRGDVADVFGGGDLYGLPSPGLTLSGLIVALAAGLLLVVLGVVPMPVNAARLAGWSLALVGATGAWMAAASSFYWLGTGFTTLLGVVSSNPHDETRMWVVSPVLVAVGSVVMLGAFLRVATGVVSKRDGLRAAADGNARAVLLAALLLAVVLAVPWSFQVLDGDERRDNGECRADATCEGRIDWYAAWGASGDADLAELQGGFVGGPADGLFGGILSIHDNAEQFDVSVWGHASLSLKVLTAAAWTAFFVGFLATLGHVLASAFNAPVLPKVTTALHLPGLAMTAWATVHYVLLCAYQWRPTYDDAVLPDVSVWWFAFLPFAVVPLLGMLVWKQVHVVRPLFARIKDAAKAQTAQAHSFD